MFTVSADTDALFGDLALIIDEEAVRGMHQADEIVADRARQSHAWQNQSGKLESMTLAGNAGGSIVDGSLFGEVIGDMPYGQYLEDERYRTGRIYRYLMPAFEAPQYEVEEQIELSFGRAMLRVF